MKHYFIHLTILSGILLITALAAAYTPLFAALPAWVLPIMVLYFTVIDGCEYWLIRRSVNRSPKSFIQYFLGLTVVVLFIHLAVIVTGVLLNPSTGKCFTIAFLILYIIYTVFVIAEIIHFMKHAGDNKTQGEK